jgi:hypothetical protein
MRKKEGRINDLAVSVCIFLALCMFV